MGRHSNLPPGIHDNTSSTQATTLANRALHPKASPPAMPFRAPPASQHRNVLVRRPASPTAAASSSRPPLDAETERSPGRSLVVPGHTTLRLPKPPPPPKPLYLTVRARTDNVTAGQLHVTKEEEVVEKGEQGEEERTRADSGLKKKRGALPTCVAGGHGESTSANDPAAEALTPTDDTPSIPSPKPCTQGLTFRNAVNTGGLQMDSSPPRESRPPVGVVPDSELDAGDAAAVRHTTARGSDDPANAFRHTLFASSDSTGEFRTPAGTLRREGFVGIDGQRYSTIRFRDETGQLNIFFDPRLHNPFAPTDTGIEAVTGAGQSTSAALRVDLPGSDTLSISVQEMVLPPKEDLTFPEESPTVCEDSDKPPTTNASPTVDDSRLLPLPAQALPALALHAFTGLSECGELSFGAGEALCIEIEDVGGGWSLGYTLRGGEAGRGLIPRAWFAVQLSML